jgi:glucose dehydrogenase
LRSVGPRRECNAWDPAAFTGRQRVERGPAVAQFFDALVKVPECAYPNAAYAPHPRSDDLDFYYVQSGPDKFSSTYLRQVGGTT